MKSDADVRKDVESELRWDPAVDATDIVVTVRDGVVTLTGFVRTFSEMWEAERAVKRVSGVRGVANDLKTRLPAISQRPEPEIARDVVNALLHELPHDVNDIKVVANEGLIRLEGEVGSHQNRQDAARAAGRVRYQHRQGQFHRRAGGYPSEDSGGVEAQRLARFREHCRGGKRKRGGVERNGPFVGRTQGSRTSGVASARRYKGRIAVDSLRLKRKTRMESTMTNTSSTDNAKLDAMNDMLANNWWAVGLRGIIAILFGIAAFAMPLVTMLSLVMVFAAFSLVDGIFGIIMAVRGARKGERWVWLLLNGILGLAACAVAILWPGITVLAFVFLVAAWALISGIFMLISAFRLKIDHGRIWLATGGIASVVLGILLTISPFVGALVLTFWIGAHALVLGVTLLMLAYKLRSHRPGHPSNFVAAGAA